MSTVAAIEKVARAMALHSGWDKWDTATDFTHTMGGNDPEEEREYWIELAKVAIDQIPQVAPVAQDKLDAERYRWLRESGQIVATMTGGIGLPSYTSGLLHKVQLDAMIDKAIAKERAK